MAVESVAECRWNGWPNQRGISGRMGVDWVAEWAWNTQVGKATAALSLSNQGDHTGALKTALQAVEIQKHAGYQAGRLFGLEAEAFALALSGDFEAAARTLNVLDRKAHNLGVYKFLGLPVRLLLSGELNVSRFMTPFQ